MLFLHLQVVVILPLDFPSSIDTVEPGYHFRYVFLLFSICF